MNEAQTVFLLFFAISWGIVSNVLPRWKPFHYAMWWHEGFWQPTRRILAAFALLNLVPWLLFILILVWLRGDPFAKEDWTFANASLLMARAILPGMVPFGCYRLWMAMVQTWPSVFYATNQQQVPEDFRAKEGSPPSEPDTESLRLRLPGARSNFWFGVVYVAFGLLALLPGPK
jgi:hypothetical protein